MCAGPKGTVTRTQQFLRDERLGVMLRQSANRFWFRSRDRSALLARFDWIPSGDFKLTASAFNLRNAASTIVGFHNFYRHRPARVPRCMAMPPPLPPPKSQMQIKPVSNAVEIKISTVVAISAILHHADPHEIDAAMRAMTGGEDDFFEEELAVIDVGAIDPSGPPIDWSALVTLLRTYRLHAVAVRNAPPGLEAEIVAHGLTLDRSVRPRAASVASAPAPSPAPAEKVPAAPVAVSAPIATAQPSAAMIVDTPVRAGQRIYARGCDLIITAAVNNGAEVIADGSIHIYAPLRGRALAGANGNRDARIFAAAMEAELVSVAGIYRTFENGYPEALTGRAVQIRLIGDRLYLLATSS